MPERAVHQPKDYKKTQAGRLRQRRLDRRITRLWGIVKWGATEGARVAAQAEIDRLIAEDNAKGFPAWMYGAKGPPKP